MSLCVEEEVSAYSFLDATIIKKSCGVSWASSLLSLEDAAQLRACIVSSMDLLGCV